MPSSEETVCANPARFERRLQRSPFWVPDPFEFPDMIPDAIPDMISDTLQMRPRAVAWAVLISAPLWGSLIMVGRALWSLWR
jgi:hypothetical protein